MDPAWAERAWTAMSTVMGCCGGPLEAQRGGAGARGACVQQRMGLRHRADLSLLDQPRAALPCHCSGCGFSAPPTPTLAPFARCAVEAPRLVLANTCRLSPPPANCAVPCCAARCGASAALSDIHHPASAPDSRPSQSKVDLEKIKKYSRQKATTGPVKSHHGGGPAPRPDLQVRRVIAGARLSNNCCSGSWRSVGSGVPNRCTSWLGSR